MRRGFTLLELLLAIAVTAVVAWLAAAALAPAVQGWRTLAETRTAEERLLLAGMLLRRDVRLAIPGGRQVAPLVVENDSRGARQLDRLAVLAATDEFPEPARITWRVDEDTGELVRTSRGLLHGEGAAIEMRFGRVESFSVRVLGEDGRWQENWGAAGAPVAWPQLVEVEVRAAGGVRRWIAPLLVERLL